VLHNFEENGPGGYNPQSGLILDASGALYGTTFSGGAYDAGTAFELKPLVGGGWKELVLHGFNNNGTDGESPSGPLTFDAHGNLYGTTPAGGAQGVGTVFEIKR